MASAQSSEGIIPVPAGFALDRDGVTLIHLASGFRFPANVGGFARMMEQGLDPSGEYIAVGYERRVADAEPIVVRIALVHVEEMKAKDHYRIMKPVAMSYFSAARLLSEHPFTMPSQPLVDGYQGIFEGKREGQPWRFSLTTVDYGYWDGRLASAYPASLAKQAEGDLGPLLAAFRWQRPADRQ